MSAAGRSDASAPAESLAAACRAADFIRLTATADGDALAALGQLGAALRATDVPFHASVTRVPGVTAPDADCTVAFGAEGADVALTDGPLSATAYTAARELGVDPDPLLAMAGAVAAGFSPGGDAPFYSEAEPLVTRQSGIATPVADPADGVAHTTLVHADVSGDPDAVRDALAASSVSEVSDDEDDRRRLASLAALWAAGDASERAARRVERALHPHAGGPFHTLGGYADVLDACARTTPGLGVALAIEAARTDEAPAHADEALDAWREHGRAAHTGLRAAETARHDGLFVARTDDAPLATVARLAWGYRSPEPLVLAVDGEDAALHGDGAADIATQLGQATPAEAVGRRARGYLAGIDADAAETEVRRSL
ncbi:hypothetical protein BRC72_09845 [Halobacteriales archaeon QH_7_66_36]|nr:MAG: hypothetical protein BRC72_09845 [Halobacteriales archaeon QH_7_66_36]